MNIASYLARQIEWSRRTFGEGKRTEGLCRHIEKELSEIRQKPEDLYEWVDVVILALDGYWRHGGTVEDLAAYLDTKQATNFAREWPAPVSEDVPVEHVRDDGLRRLDALLKAKAAMFDADPFLDTTEIDIQIKGAKKEAGVGEARDA